MKRIAVGALLVIASLLPTTQADAGATFTVGTKFTDGEPRCNVAAGATTPDDGALKVATFNVLHSETDEGDASLAARLPLIADTIVASQADVVGAQEVTENALFNANNEYPQKHGLVARRIAELLAQRTGTRWYWCYSRSNPHVPFTPDAQRGNGNALDNLAAAMGNFPEGGSFAEGLAIFSRYPITNARSRRMLPRTYEAPACVGTNPFCPLDATFDARQMLYGRIATPRGGVDLFNTHIAHGLTAASDVTKRLQVRQAMAVVKAWSKPDALPDFLVGDFNNGPYSRALQLARENDFYDTYRVSGEPDCHTAGDGACSGGPKNGEEVFTKTNARPMDERIDYVLARAPKQCRLRVTNSQRIADEPTKLTDGRYLWPSDHYAFVSTVGCA